MRLIDAAELYEKTAEWEAQALHMVEITMNDEDKTEWRKWSAILGERSAFKFDIADAPTVEAIPVSFINEQIEKLQGIADYEFIESGGYLGECNHELRALQDLLKHWKGRKEE